MTETRTIEITEREALALCAASGRVVGHTNGPRGSIVGLADRVVQEFKFFGMSPSNTGHGAYWYADQQLAIRGFDHVPGSKITFAGKAIRTARKLDEERNW